MNLSYIMGGSYICLFWGVRVSTSSQNVSKIKHKGNSVTAQWYQHSWDSIRVLNHQGNVLIKKVDLKAGGGVMFNQKGKNNLVMTEWIKSCSGNFSTIRLGLYVNIRLIQEGILFVGSDISFRWLVRS